ncbi:MAG TPA: division/cell wall cluster transcriptional repressor MraZ [Mycobacteriales bacterium]|nr:division/cell wall cluster transcriptional repressor MraZ [Mycobacteriales bacterium]HWB66752.1 division/cell wall cluster transcriptional repressor MraZ [Mycobacteriales bacterium]
MFLGTFTPRLDDKGRLFLPAKFRDELAAGLVITPGQERCLRVFPIAEFARVTQVAREAPTSLRETRDFHRMAFGDAHDEVPDRQGRVTVPAALREYAGLTRDCAVVGLNSYLEIWDEAAWREYKSSQADAYASLSEQGVPGLF